MKSSIDAICKPLAHIFNLSLTTGIVPTDMKLAKVTPVYKSGNKQQFTNYRPISILPSFSKLVEKIVAKKLIAFLENNNLLYEHQYGFRPKKSTIHPIIHLLNDIAIANDKPTKDVTLGLFIDLSKAFNTMSHHILLSKMYKLGIRGIANDWFRSYLSERQQYVQIGKVRSINCGVPQGSILGPILFIIYINDLHTATNLNVLTFADDTTIYSSGNNANDLITHVKTEFHKIFEWCCANKLRP